tara:strand:+ start:508 stop:609 length:102 start_codon:yes stop_codon:yes gene_type:complete
MKFFPRVAGGRRAQHFCPAGTVCGFPFGGDPIK